MGRHLGKQKERSVGEWPLGKTGSVDEGEKLGLLGGRVLAWNRSGEL